MKITTWPRLLSFALVLVVAWPVSVPSQRGAGQEARQKVVSANDLAAIHGPHVWPVSRAPSWEAVFASSR
jgi:hypothetical protein